MNDSVAMTGKFSVEFGGDIARVDRKAERQIFVIGEIGINHNGDIDLAKQMIDLAAEVGSDAVKFQKRTLDVVYTREFLDSPRESPFGDTQRAQKEG